MINLEQRHHLVLIANRARECSCSPCPVREGEYALREPSEAARHSKEGGELPSPLYFLPEFPTPSVESEETALTDVLFGGFPLLSVPSVGGDYGLYGDISDSGANALNLWYEGEVLTIGHGSNNGPGGSSLLSILGRWFGHLVRPPVQSQTSRAVELLWGDRFRRPASYGVPDNSSTLSGRLARAFLLAEWRELFDNRRDLATKRAIARAHRIRVEPGSTLVSETGSAAAIAKRMNPLGAPPSLEEGERYATCS